MQGCGLWEDAQKRFYQRVFLNLFFLAGPCPPVCKKHFEGTSPTPSTACHTHPLDNVWSSGHAQQVSPVTCSILQLHKLCTAWHARGSLPRALW